MDDRFSRQADIVPRQRILDCKATVIGVGAIGRQVSLQLTAIGVPHLQIIDFDYVEISNLASQGYLAKDLHKPKVDATAEFCRQMNPELVIEVVLDRFKRSTTVGNYVFVCVDSIETRKIIWDALKDKVSFLCDGRMSAEVLRVITAYDEKSRKYYPQTLFAAEQAYAGPCTAKTTIYCANIAAGFMLAQFTKYLRLLPVEPDVQVNLLAMEMNVPNGGN
ncbi:MAG: thiamine biosynthesis protein ThiF [Planctomycetes bacterium GWF2_41_51]|nr:MAG: thiamine biosynthesis protein ThiF [Planctomycetes bacterium GWF2_41_51]HBG27913.1 thiamine biosynthesis protein ThiF [Phycisphaerales bacterium]